MVFLGPAEWRFNALKSFDSNGIDEVLSRFGPAGVLR